MSQTSGHIYVSPSGTEIVGENDGDTLLWNAEDGVWVAGPGGGGGAVDSVFGRTGDVVAETDDYSSDQITNLSEWDGANVTDALMEIQSRFTNLTSSQVQNASGVSGPSVSDALDTLNVEIAAVAGGVAALNSDDIANASAVPGGTVTEALDALLAGRSLLGVASRLTAGAQTIACPSGTRAVLVRMGGAGAGGGGALQTAAPSQTNSGGGGGGAGAEQEFFYTAASDIASIDVVCGTAGTGQPTTGGNGTATTVTINGETFTSNPGEGGSQGVTTGAPVSSGARGGLPGQFNFQTGSNFTLLRSSGGQPGENGTGPNGTLLIWYGGMGGSSTWGGGGRGGFSGNGEAATGNCAGGGGGSSSAGNNRNGANGTPGAVMLLFFGA